jgi:hypothetical protein
MKTFIDHYKAIQIKTGLKADGIVGTVEEWVAELPNGTTISNVEISAEEIAAAKIIRENEEIATKETKAAEKTAVLAKLGLTAEEVAALLS